MPALPVLSGIEVVRNHKEVARGTLRSLIRAADLTVDEFFSP
jgi:hypothetical protein